MTQGLWCESCGSPVPEGYDSCPVCGMPVDDPSSVEAEPPEASEASDADDERAVAPMPEELRATHEQRINGNLALIAACVALVLVGGAALIITRPWDPNPYSISATVAADTSMEGYPGKKSHLNDQDRTEESQYLLLNELDVLLAEVSEADQPDEGLLGRLDDTARQVEGLDIVDDELAARRDALLERYRTIGSSQEETAAE